MRFIAIRVVNGVALVLVACAGGYVLAGLALDPAAPFRGHNPPVPQSSIDAQLRAMGVDPHVSLPLRLRAWMVGLLLHGSLGMSTRGRPVTAEIAERAGTSLRLLLVGTILGIVLGVAVGVLGAVHRRRWFDRLSTWVSFVVLATPAFVLAVTLMVAATRVNTAAGRTVLRFTGEYTPGASTGGWSALLDRANHLLLPSVVVIALTAALISRYQRAAMLDELAGDHVRAARARGLTRRSALVRHGVRMALVPMSALFAYTFGLVLTGATVTELAFGWHGMGEYLVRAVTDHDVNAAAGTTAFTAVLVVVAGTAADLLHGALDPRVRG